MSEFEWYKDFKNWLSLKKVITDLVQFVKIELRILGVLQVITFCEMYYVIFIKKISQNPVDTIKVSQLIIAFKF